jgi:hypothetical protein
MYGGHVSGWAPAPMMKRSMVVVCLALLAGCANASSGTDDAPQEADLTKAPAFTGSGGGSAVKVKDYDAKLIAPSAGLAKLLGDMTKIGGEQNVSFFAGTYKLSTGDIAQWDEPLNNHWYQNNMAYDLMFRIDKSFDWAEKWNPDYERVSCQVVKDQKKAWTRFSAFQGYVAAHGDTQAPAADRAALENAAKTAVGSLMKDLGGAKLYKCHWDNTDDTDTDALVTIDAKSGEIRVLVAFAGA